jgi:hypothetical protein
MLRDDRSRLWVRVAVAAIGLVALSDVTHAEDRASVGCPPPGKVPLDWTAKQLVEACPPIPPAPSTSSTASGLNCENLKTLARASVGTGNSPDVLVAQQTLDASCRPTPTGSAVVAPPPPPPPRPASYTFSRGYNSPPRGSQGICDQYTGTAEVANGRITFDSSSYRWTGTVSSDGFVSIRTGGIAPLGNQKPLKHETAILGPMGKASMYNGYCGYGYFRLT